MKFLQKLKAILMFNFTEKIEAEEMFQDVMNIVNQFNLENVSLNNEELKYIFPGIKNVTFYSGGLVYVHAKLIHGFRSLREIKIAKKVIFLPADNKYQTEGSIEYPLCTYYPDRRISYNKHLWKRRLKKLTKQLEQLQLFTQRMKSMHKLVNMYVDAQQYQG
jgi:hypothetical protein